jgi:hypothetical protein
VKQLAVSIERSANYAIPATVYDFEYPVLQAIHGDEAVKIDSEREVSDLSAYDAYGLLVTRYGDAATKAVFKTEADLGRLMGLGKQKAASKA